MPQEEDRADRPRRRRNGAGQGSGGDMDGPSEIDRPLRQFVGRWRGLLQAQGVGVWKNRQLIQVDRAQFVTEVSKTMMEERPRNG
jgi:hypothetical protein